MSITKDDLLEFLEVEVGIEPSEVENDTALFSSGLVDSFALVTLMLHLEKLGDFRINPTDVTLDNLDTVDRILKYVNSIAA